MSNNLIAWNKARIAVEEARDLKDLKNIHDELVAMKALAKMLNESLEVQNNVAEIRIRAEKKMGEMLKREIKQGGDRKSKLHGATLKLNDIGIEKTKSHRFQKIADIPTDKFEKQITETKEANKELTSSGMLSLAKSIEREELIKKQKHIIENGIEKPTGLFDVVCVDPPWEYGTKYNSEGRRSANPYPEMSLEEIMDIDLPLKENAIVWLWTTHKFMRYSFDILDYWGLRDVAILTWAKNRMGLGSWLRSQSEFCIMAVKGKPIIDLKNQTTIITGDIREHSRKPKEFYEMVNSLCIGRKLDYFGREKHNNWEIYGNDTNKF